MNSREWIFLFIFVATIIGASALIYNRRVDKCSELCAPALGQVQQGHYSSMCYCVVNGTLVPKKIMW
jgi:cytochrome c biogenesis factor